MQEEKHCNTAYFITLTYDNEHVPITPKGFMGLGSEVRRRKGTFSRISHLSDFFKRVRAHSGTCSQEVAKGTRSTFSISEYATALQPKPIKYFGVGEYGGRSKRPHFHAIVFNASQEAILASWKLGHVHFGQVSEASVGYCMKYMLKKGCIPMHNNDDRPAEYALMSKGLGSSYITDQNMRWHHASLDRLYVNVKGGIKASMPRYYKDRLLDSSYRNWAGRFQLARMEAMRYELGNGYYRDKFPVLEKIKYEYNDAMKRQFLIDKNAVL